LGQILFAQSDDVWPRVSLERQSEIWVDRKGLLAERALPSGESSGSSAYGSIDENKKDPFPHAVFCEPFRDTSTAWAGLTRTGISSSRQRVIVIGDRCLGSII
jgi:hypothetical protein